MRSVTSITGEGDKERGCGSTGYIKLSSVDYCYKPSLLAFVLMVLITVTFLILGVLMIGVDLIFIPFTISFDTADNAARGVAGRERGRG